MKAVKQMPKPTFFNLPDEKRQVVLHAAIDEFAVNSFQSASISSIVEAAGIAKGSFYQYFEDKEDLFRHLLIETGNMKLQYLTRMLTQMQELTFFELMRELFAGGIRFAQANPKLALIGNRFIKETDPVFKERILGEMAPRSNEFLEQLVRAGVEKGELRPDLDANLTAFLLTHVSIATGEFYMAGRQQDDYEDFLPLVDRVLRLLAQGIQQGE